MGRKAKAEHEEMLKREEDAKRMIQQADEDMRKAKAEHEEAQEKLQEKLRRDLKEQLKADKQELSEKFEQDKQKQEIKIKQFTEKQIQAAWERDQKGKEIKSLSEKLSGT